MKNINKIEFEFCTLTLRNDDIIEQYFLRETPYEVDEKFMQDSIDAMTLLSKGEKKALLSIPGLYGTITPEARKISLSGSNSYTLALGLVITELSQRLLVNFYFKIKKTPYPVKIFKTEKEAVAWLHHQIRLSRKAV